MAFVQEVLAEKDEAIDLSGQSLKELRSARDAFREADYDCLERQLSFQQRWAGLWRELVRAFLLHRVGLVQGQTPEVSAELADALAALERQADELQAAFGSDVFPHGPDRARQFARALGKAVND